MVMSSTRIRYLGNGYVLYVLIAASWAWLLLIRTWWVMICWNAPIRWCPCACSAGTYASTILRSRWMANTRYGRVVQLHALFFEINLVFRVRIDESVPDVDAGNPENVILAHLGRLAGELNDALLEAWHVRCSDGRHRHGSRGFPVCWYSACVTSGSGIKQCLPLGRCFSKCRIDHGLHHVELASQVSVWHSGVRFEHRSNGKARFEALSGEWPWHNIS